MHVTFILTPTATTRYAEWLKEEASGFYSKPHGRRLARPQPALAALLPDEQRYGDDMLPCGVRNSRYMGCGGNGFVLDGNVLHVAGRRHGVRHFLPDEGEYTSWEYRQTETPSLSPWETTT